MLAERHSVFTTSAMGTAYWTDAASGQTQLHRRSCRRAGPLPPSTPTRPCWPGTYIEGDGKDYNSNRNQQSHPLDQPLNKGQMMEERWAARLPMAMFTLNIQTGERKIIHRANDWLNHLLFSPVRTPRFADVLS